MSLVGVAGLLIALSAAYFAKWQGSRARVAVFFMLFALHSVSSVVYYFFAEASGSDAHLYYYDPMRLYRFESGLGTIFVINFVQALKENLGGTFFDYFMIFQAMGFWGMVFLAKTFNEIFDELEVPQGPLTYLPLFLPGLHFWPSAIGKDAPLFLAISLALWATMRFNKRLIALGIAIMIMLAVRPHIAMVTLAALATAGLVDSRIKLWIKGVMLVGILAAGVAVTSSLETTYRLDVTSAESVSDFMSARNNIGEDSGVDFSITQGNVAVKVLSLWLRPFFYDAENAMGYIASFENVGILVLFLIVFGQPRLLRRLFARVLYFRFSLVFFILLTALLATVNFNVGLGLRQKMMAMPCLLAMVATFMAVRAAQRQSARPEPQPLMRGSLLPRGAE